MKNIFLSILVITVFASSGCVKRIEITTIQKDRVDQNLSTGNQGYLSGVVPPTDEPKIRAEKREIYEVRVDLPPYREWQRYRNPDKDLWGNLGYLYGGPHKDRPSPQQQKQIGNEFVTPIILPDEGISDSASTMDDLDIPVILPKEQVRVKQTSYSSYKVQKGDTLQKISKKIFGTTKKWQLIYKLNKDALKSPNKIYPGQRIKIPPK
ncbi:MAG: hypothetical protein DRP78_05750 [Candidatus Omnitrophota bacterium]|nr:MAG: hypothetical protein DRP78_05750 [Candidatus Omnitrophota bacterium]